jgi:hypothetical protein
MKKTNTSNPLKFFNDNKAMAYKKAGGEMDAFKKSLKRMDNGGGSGMGRMAADDAAFDAMMNQPTSSPRTSPYPSPESARLLAAQAAKDAAMTMQGSGSQNVERANAIIRNTPRGVVNSLPKEEINRMNTTPKTGIPPSNEELNYMKLRQEAINNKGAKNGGMMKKGGTHKMPNSKVMLNSKMKKVGVIKSKKK